MPGLIDFDKLMEQYDFYNEFAVHDLRYLKKECLPFVDAIPIEWIKEHIAELRAEVERKIEEENYTDYGLCDDAYGMERLLEDWEKENEESSNSD